MTDGGGSVSGLKGSAGSLGDVAQAVSGGFLMIWVATTDAEDAAYALCSALDSEPDYRGAALRAEAIWGPA